MPDLPEPTNRIEQKTEGDRNLTAGQVSHSTLIGNVEQFTQTVQSLPRALSLHQLPSDIADFTGRQQQIDEIVGLLQPVLGKTSQAVIISAIAGMAGVGKSALAIHVAHQLKDQFPDAQLYVNLRGAENEQPTEPLEVLARFLRALGVEEAQIPRELTERAELFRSQMHQRQALVLLDNAANVQQVQPLLPGSPGCAVLVTSRKRLEALDGATICELPLLLEDEAQVLLEKLISKDRIEAEPDAAEQIVWLCGRLPLAVRIAGGTLRRRSWEGRRLADYVALLEDEQQRLVQLRLEGVPDRDVRASFALSYQELADEEAQLFRLLGLLPQDFGIGVAAALMDVESVTSQAAIDRLVDAQLLEVDENRYQLHDLMRLFAREQLEQQESQEVILAVKGRVVQCYWNQADFWGNALHPAVRRKLAQAVATEQKDTSPKALATTEQALIEAALKWFEAERLNLIHTVEWAYQQPQDWSKIVSFAATLSPFHDIRGYWQDSELIHQLAIEAARNLQDRDAEGQAFNNLGIVRRKQGRWQEAIDCYQQSLTLERSIDDRHGEGQTLNNLGSVYYKQGRWQEAIDCYQQSLETKRSVGDRYGEGQTLNNLGLVYSDQGRWQEAIDCYQQSLETKRSVGDRYGEGQTLNNLGSVYHKQGQWQEAIDCYQQDLEICCSVRDQHGEGTTLNNLGLVYSDQGRWQEAIDCYQRSLKIHNILGDRHGEGQTLNNLGSVYYKQGQWQEAIDCYEQSLDIFCSVGDQHGEANTLGNLGNVYSNQGWWQKAIDCYEQSLGIFCSVGDQHGEGQTLINLGMLYAAQGQLERAKAAWQEALTKLHPDSPEFQQLKISLESNHHPQQARRLKLFMRFVLPGAVLSFLLLNAWLGHWLIALGGLLVVVILFLLHRDQQVRG